MSKILRVALIVTVLFAGLGWYFFAPPISFYSFGTNGKLENNALFVYSPRYRMHWTGVNIRSGNFEQDNRYLFCWFWSGYGIKSVKIYSSSGEVLYDNNNGARKDVYGSSSENFYVWLDAEQDWLGRDASVYLGVNPGEMIKVVILDKFGNQSEKVIRAPAA